MLRVCNLGNHLFEDGRKEKSTEETTQNVLLATREQVACKECWDKFSNEALESIRKVLKD